MPPVHAPPSDAPSPHAVSVKATLATAVALLVLWGVSFGLSYVHLGRWSFAIALAIAAAKAALVVLFFMELSVARASMRASLVIAAVLIALLVGLMAGDVVTRARVPYETGGAF
jgi:cytochrome c oxidase subunit 4